MYKYKLNEDVTEKDILLPANHQINKAELLFSKIEDKTIDFQLEKYPGSESAASYASEVTVIAPEETFDYRIFMNNILDYKGYKFFQSSYDLSGPVEQSHLSVNHDWWGTFITYLGYSFLYTQVWFLSDI